MPLIPKVFVLLQAKTYQSCTIRFGMILFFAGFDRMLLSAVPSGQCFRQRHYTANTAAPLDCSLLWFCCLVPPVVSADVFSHLS